MGLAWGRESGLKWGNMSRINNPENSLPYFLRGAFREFETALGRYLAEFGLPLSYFYILRLQWNENGNSQVDIANRAFMTQSVASQVLKKMENSNLVRRKTDPKDGRSRIVQLTATGEALRERIASDGIKISNENAPDISRQDMKTAIEVLIKVRLGFEEFNRQNDLADQTG